MANPHHAALWLSPGARLEMDTHTLYSLWGLCTRPLGCLYCSLTLFPQAMACPGDPGNHGGPSHVSQHTSVSVLAHPGALANPNVQV